MRTVTTEVVRVSFPSIKRVGRRCFNHQHSSTISYFIRSPFLVEPFSWLSFAVSGACGAMCLFLSATTVGTGLILGDIEAGVLNTQGKWHRQGTPAERGKQIRAFYAQWTMWYRMRTHHCLFLRSQCSLSKTLPRARCSKLLVSSTCTQVKPLGMSMLQ